MNQTAETVNVKVDDHDWDRYKLVSEHYRQDLREFWSRSSLYILSQAFLFAAFAALVSQSRVVDGKVLPIHLHDVVFEVTLGLIGAVVALVGFFAAYASTIWLHRWRKQMIELDEAIDRHHCFAKVEGVYGSRKNEDIFLADPVKLTMWVPFFFFLGWVVMTATVIAAFVNSQFWG